MYRRQLIGVFLLLSLVGCAAPAAVPADVVETAVAAPIATSHPPEQVTDAFFTWYLDSIGPRADGEFVNPLSEKLYRDSIYLTPRFIDQLDAALVDSGQTAFDPILQAQDVPERVAVGETAVNETAATVILLRYWGGNPDPDPITVHLQQQEDGQWRIDNITAFEIPADPPADAPSAVEPAEELLVAPETPDTVARAFYAWYLGYFGDRSGGIVNNPLVDEAYHDSPYLTESFIQHMDEQLAIMRESVGGADPFLCAQNIPEFVEPEVTFARNGMASVVMRSSFPNQRFVVDLYPDGESWLIGNISCGSGATGVAKAFYTWYLGTIGDRAGGDFRNPLTDAAYRDYPRLAPELVAEVDALLAEDGQANYDPFLLAQDVPTDFSVDPGVAAGTAVVHLQFGENSVTHLRVTLTETGQILSITEDGGLSAGPSPNSAGWQTFTGNGFSFAYPPEWKVTELAPAAGGPEDWPVVATWLIMPEEIADAVTAGGTPDPTAPVVVAPFNVEWVQGDEADLARVYGEIDGEFVVFGEQTGILLQREPGITHVLFADPTQPDVWLVFTDWVSGFPGRAGQAETAVPVWPLLLDSLQFN